MQAPSLKESVQPDEWRLRCDLVCADISAKLLDSRLPVNSAGFVIHSAVHDA